MKFNNPIRQHYVPKFILKNFVNINNTVFVFDKENSKNFQSSINNIFVSKNFYTIDNNFYIEKYYSNEETSISNIIQDILIKKTISHFSY